MNRYQNTYEEALELNFANEEKWKKYKKDLVDTKGNLQEFVKSRSINIMVPMGKKAFVRGTFKHTNEITVSHGASYFSNVSTAQAIGILEHRIKSCDERLQAIHQERDLFTNKLKLPEDVFAGREREIIEEYNENAEKAWRRKHAESVRRQKQKEAEDRLKEEKRDIDVNQFFEEYEMMEELANELESLDIEDDETLSKVLSGTMKIPESKLRVAHNLVSVNNGNIETQAAEPPPLSQSMTTSKQNLPEINNNDLISQSNQEIVDLLRTYRSKIKDVLRSVKKDDEKNVNLFLDLIELKDDIEDDIRKMNDDEEYSESDERDSDDETTVSIDVKPEETKRKVRFSTSLEDVKLIESKSELMENGFSEDNNTIHINFKHSDAKFSSVTSNDGIIANPGEIHRLFKKELKHLASPIAMKSILKNKGAEPKSPEIIDEKSIKKIFHSDFHIIGDVVEHKMNASLNKEEVIHIMSKDEAPIKVSKFKQMRLKS